MLIAFTGTSGKIIYSTVKRLADGYFLHNSSFTFVSAPTFANKSIALIEGSNEELGYYSDDLDSSGWNDGLYEVKIHDGDNSNIVMAGVTVGMMNGIETTPGNEIPIYHCDINFVKDDINSFDEYLISFFKNGSIVSSGITSPTITVTSKTATVIINAATLTNATGGLYRYVASTSERQTYGEIYNVTISATHGGNSISFSSNLGRDAT